MKSALMALIVSLFAQLAAAMDVQSYQLTQLMLKDIKQSGLLDPFMEIEATLDQGEHTYRVGMKFYSLDLIGKALVGNDQMNCTAQICHLKKFRVESLSPAQQKKQNIKASIVADLFLDKNADGQDDIKTGTVVSIGFVSSQGVLRLDKKVTITITDETATTVFEKLRGLGGRKTQAALQL